MPDESLPPIGTLGFRVQRYGMLQWGDLFTVRQKMAITTLIRALPTGDTAAFRPLLAFAVSKQSDFNSSLSRWANHMEKSVATFGRQALPILWDWGEVVPTSNASGAFDVAVDWIANAAATIQEIVNSRAKFRSRMLVSLLCRMKQAGCGGDPPYYDAIPYSDLSDYPCRLKLVPGTLLLGDPYDSNNPLSPKTREAVQDECG